MKFKKVISVLSTSFLMTNFANFGSVNATGKGKGKLDRNCLKQVSQYLDGKDLDNFKKVYDTTKNAEQLNALRKFANVPKSTSSCSYKTNLEEIYLRQNRTKGIEKQRRK